MPCDAVIEKTAYDALPEAVRKDYYREGTKEEGMEGKYVLDVTPHPSGFALENVQGLKTTLQTVRGERDAANTNLKKFDGLDATQAREALAQIEKLKDAIPKDQMTTLVEQQVAEIKRKLEGDLQSENTLRKSREAMIESLMVDSVAAQALVKLNGNPKLLMPHVKAQTKVEWDGDKPVARVIDPNTGQVRVTLKQGSTDPMGVEELVELMSKEPDYKPGFKGSGASGMGASGSGGGGTVSDDPSKTAGLSPTERLKAHHRSSNGGN